MKEKEKPVGVVEFLMATADDPEVPDKYRIQAGALIVDPNANPFAPPIRLTVANDKVLGHANFGAPFEGTPGNVHGGFVAAAFDQVLFMAQSLTGIPAMTRTLTVAIADLHRCLPNWYSKVWSNGLKGGRSSREERHRRMEF